MDVYFDLMKKKHIPELLHLECGAGRRIWTREDFEKAERTENGIVAVVDGRVVGFLVYQLQRNRIKLLNLAVAEECRRQGIGQGMLARLSVRLNPDRRSHITVDVRERNLDAQLFFRDCGFLAGPDSVKREFYADTGEDAYSLRYDLKVAVPVESPELEVAEV